MFDHSAQFVVIDGYGFVFRAYHTHPHLTSPNKQPVGAIYGFTSMLLKILQDFRPQRAVIVLDHKDKNFRHDIYPEYKSNRPILDQELVVQLELLTEVATALNFCSLEKIGFEADDIIATIANKYSLMDQNVIIISSDKDLVQLMNERVKIYDPVKSRYIDESDVLEKFGVAPDKVRDVQSLMGDRSDNIPGVKGIGSKTAAKLINHFGSLNHLLNSIDDIPNSKHKELILQYKELALTSWKLAGLDSNVDIELLDKNFVWSPPSIGVISDFLYRFGFKSLYKRVEDLFNIDISKEICLIESASKDMDRKVDINNITSIDIFNKMLEQVNISGAVGIDILKTDQVIDITFVAADDTELVSLIYIMKIHVISKESLDISEDSYIKNYIYITPEDERLLQKFYQFLSDTSIKKIFFDVKILLKLFNQPVKSYVSLELMDYLLSAGNKTKTLPELVECYLDRSIIQHLEMPGIYSIYFVELYRILEQKLYKNKVLSLYFNIDLPLAEVVNQMESSGIAINIEYLSQLSEIYALEISALEQKIFQLAGENFNISSPKQLSEILFTKMQLPYKTNAKSKSKNYSTAVDILEKLKFDGYQIADLLLQYRHFSKLKNTYTDALPKQVNPSTQRIHTTFLQNTTSTGRLTSHNPNLQNIPIKTEEGFNIRAAFVAKNMHVLLSADYSQIELRILSHVANVLDLKRSFINNKDIHTITASQIFSVPEESVNTELRYKAKTINFSIIYGISAFGLSQRLNINVQDAQNYIDKYFIQYPEIKNYMDYTVKFAEDNGYVKNILGRKIYIPSINDKNHTVRAFGKRAAINAPIQSLASDIVKIAMIKIHQKINALSLSTKMILQIHDELVFEVPSSELEIMVNLLKQIMENILILDIPMKIGIKYGENLKAMSFLH
ncbi:DNA polymerase I [Rickettsia endosymbiont of Cardiosporidium cionae]|uniref:DNA polymerase I n=1 Tax=Rickettsia endosymbiont of Cardiosporidium cionae TaxID=2777155 RepID=UPI0018935F5A|nr:DNA polymerase I [Rickettsia endosymbiont of Cardiosporidium cionae]KAF8818479.1 DNA polymerase I [Rickettsia endosymbiont of Cardiosporidium cionae]